MPLGDGSACIEFAARTEKRSRFVALKMAQFTSQANPDDRGALFTYEVFIAAAQHR